MTDTTSSHPDISDLLARKANGRRQRAAISFAEKLDALDELRDRVAPIVRAREARKTSSEA